MSKVKKKVKGNRKPKTRKAKVVRPTARLDWSMRNTGTVSVCEFLKSQGATKIRDMESGKTYKLDETGIEAICVLRPHGKEANGGLPIAKIVLAALKIWCRAKKESGE